MSCILNTMSENAREHFEESDHEEVLEPVRPLGFIPGFVQHPSSSLMREYVACLEEGGVDGLRKELIVRWGVLNTHHSDTKILRDEAVMEDKVIEIFIPL